MTIQEKLELLQEFLGDLQITIEAAIDEVGEPHLVVQDQGGSEILLGVIPDLVLPAE